MFLKWMMLACIVFAEDMIVVDAVGKEDVTAIDKTMNEHGHVSYMTFIVPQHEPRHVPRAIFATPSYETKIWYNDASGVTSLQKITLSCRQASDCDCTIKIVKTNGALPLEAKCKVPSERSLRDPYYHDACRIKVYSHLTIPTHFDYCEVLNPSVKIEPKDTLQSTLFDSKVTVMVPNYKGVWQMKSNLKSPDHLYTISCKPNEKCNCELIFLYRTATPTKCGTEYKSKSSQMRDFDGNCHVSISLKDGSCQANLIDIDTDTKPLAIRDVSEPPSKEDDAEISEFVYNVPTSGDGIDLLFAIPKTEGEFLGCNQKCQCSHIKYRGTAYSDPTIYDSITPCDDWRAEMDNELGTTTVCRVGLKITKYKPYTLLPVLKQYRNLGPHAHVGVFV